MVVIMSLGISNVKVHASTGRQAIIDAAEYYYNTTWRPAIGVHGFYAVYSEAANEKSMLELWETRKGKGISVDNSGRLRIDHYYDTNHTYHIAYGQINPYEDQMVLNDGRYIDGTDRTMNANVPMDEYQMAVQIPPNGKEFKMGDYYYWRDDLEFYRVAMFMDCSAFVCTCWNIDRWTCDLLLRYRTDRQFIEDTGVGNLEDGDALVYPTHVVLVTGHEILRDREGNDITYYMIVEESGIDGAMIKSFISYDTLMKKYGRYSLLKPTPEELGRLSWTRGTNGVRVGYQNSRDNDTGNNHLE